MLSGSDIHRYVLAAVLVVASAAIYLQLESSDSLAAEDSMLRGRVASATGQPLAGVPIRAHRVDTNVTVSVYTNRQGEYSFPGWSDLWPGSYRLAIDLPDFDPVTRDVVVPGAKPARADFALRARRPSIADATAADIVAALPGTDEQKHLLIQCDNCHSLQFALRTGRTKEGWTQIVRRMAGERAVSRETPGTRAFGQKKYVEPLAEYLASIRGPGSSGELPFQLRPRPTGEASTRLVITEYDIPRGGHRDLSIIRGDKRFAWPHTSCSIPRGRTPITRTTSASTSGVSIGEPEKSKNSRTTFSPEWAGKAWA